MSEAGRRRRGRFAIPSRLAGCIVLLAVAATGCIGTKPTAAADGVVLPRLGPFDTGVVSDIKVLAGVPTGPKDDVETEVRLDDCAHVAPGRWVLRGTVRAGPAARTVAEVDFDRGDVGSGVGVSLALAGPGDFTMPLALPLQAALWAEDADRCDLRIGEGASSSLPSAAVTTPDAPLEYAAPDGTVQALGIGARMSGPATMQQVWATVAWLRLGIPFDSVWAPRDASRASPRPDSVLDQFRQRSDPGASRTNCLSFEYTVDAVGVLESAGCSAVPALVEPVEGAPGFRWVRDPGSGRIEAVRELADKRITLYGDSKTAVAAVAAELRPMRNLVVDTRGDARATTADDLIHERFGSGGDFGTIVDQVDRAHFGTADDYVAVLTGRAASACANCTPGAIGTFHVWEAEGRPGVESGEGGSWDGCLYSSTGWGQDTGVIVLVIARDPTWTIEVADADRWHPTIANGVWYQTYPDLGPDTVGPTVSLRDASGHTVTCPGS